MLLSVHAFGGRAGVAPARLESAARATNPWAPALLPSPARRCCAFPAGISHAGGGSPAWRRAGRQSSRGSSWPVRASTGGGEQGVPMAVGTAVVVTQLPQFLKTADPMPMLRPATMIKVGEAGRVMDRRPKNTWAVRFKAGVFLIDGSCIELLDI